MFQVISGNYQPGGQNILQTTLSVDVIFSTSAGEYQIGILAINPRNGQ